jgi:N-acetylneuraminate synthase
VGNTFIIAEAGVNHNGSLDNAKKMVIAAKKANVDAIKFQTFTGEKVISQFAPKADYQVQATGNQESQLEMVKNLELNTDEHFELMAFCQKKDLQFLSTPFDMDSVDLLIRDMDIPCIKIPSGEITNAPMILKIAQSGKPIILSTGMSTIGDIEKALGVIAFGYTNQNLVPSFDAFLESYCSTEGQKSLLEKVSLLHCTTQYPAPFESVNLNVIDTLQRAFGLPTGLSDHTLGITIPIAAVARGAAIIEKHFTLDKSLSGPDHKASLDLNELVQMTTAIRQTEQALGSSRKFSTSAEWKNKIIARKSLIAAKDIEKGEIFTRDNLTIKRPGNGISPFRYWEMLGKKSKSNIKYDELISN